MKIVKLEGGNSNRILSGAERTLRSGGIVAVPTDTVYGILGDATNTRVIRRIFSLKGRPRERAFPIFVKDVATARKYAYISDTKTGFLKKVWPGAVTAVLHYKEKLPKILTGGKDTIGIRIPNHQFILDLLSRLEIPLVQTSANISGKTPAKTTQEIKAYFGKSPVMPDLVIDGGTCGGKPSTVIDFTRDEPIILRGGFSSKKELVEFLDSLQAVSKK